MTRPPRFPHHDWADADGLEEPDPDFARTGYYRNDPDSHSDRLRVWHQRLWSKPPLDLRPWGSGLVDAGSGSVLTSDSAMPVWERWTVVQPLIPATEVDLKAAGRGSIHDIGWHLYDMGGMILFPGLQVYGQWTINQAKGCLRRIADRLDLTLECVRLYYEFLGQDPGTTTAGPLPNGYDQSNPLGSVLHRYEPFFRLFSSFQGYVDFWLLQDLVTTGGQAPRVRFLMGGDAEGGYDFTTESALPTSSEEYRDYLIAAEDFVEQRNHRMAAEAIRLGHPVADEYNPA